MSLPKILYLSYFEVIFLNIDLQIINNYPISLMYSLALKNSQKISRAKHNLNYSTFSTLLVFVLDGSCTNYFYLKKIIST